MFSCFFILFTVTTSRIMIGKFTKFDAEISSVNIVKSRNNNRRNEISLNQSNCNISTETVGKHEICTEGSNESNVIFESLHQLEMGDDDNLPFFSLSQLSSASNYFLQQPEPLIISLGPFFARIKQYNDEEGNYEHYHNSINSHCDISLPQSFHSFHIPECAAFNSARVFILFAVMLSLVTLYVELHTMWIIPSQSRIWSEQSFRFKIGKITAAGTGK